MTNERAVYCLLQIYKSGNLKYHWFQLFRDVMLYQNARSFDSQRVEQCWLKWPSGFACVCVLRVCGLRAMFSFSARFEQAILFASCNANLHWFSTRHGASDLVRDFFVIYIMCGFVFGQQCKYFEVSF